ncbi:hypothetical protein J0871_00665 [Salegentibacter sp. BDJ18]|uniref:hypothetical protein n=1 Tax=Salegentibacter sp. BDJ18 TaxID=2816376 RepID=UPI001AAFEF52|nr:hypothetical protein [Salegentibacter sp. BDJ18]MBO2542915.1 hypothetical protein [Salegentibacter sp. BDJ18]
MYNDNWSANFVQEKLEEFDNVSSITVEDSNYIIIDRKEGPRFKVFSLSLEDINYAEIHEIVQGYPQVNFISNIKKSFKIDGESLHYLESSGISFGTMSDVMRFTRQKNNSLYLDKEYGFVKRGLKQHTKVLNLERLDNRRILIERLNMKDVIAVMNNDYDLGVESVRSTKAKFVDFKVILSTNPNARITEDAEAVAKDLGIYICSWGNFLGKLNSFWN